MEIDVGNKFVKKLSKAPKLAKSDSSFLTADAKEAFFQLQQIFTKALILSYFDSKQ